MALKGLQVCKFYLVFFALCPAFGFAQIELKGRVIQDQTELPIAYVNIGFISSNIGTSSDADGSFSLRIPEQRANDTLTFSALGFVTRSVAIQFLLSKSEIVVRLKEEAIFLNEVVVEEKLEKNKFFKLGNTECKGGVMEIDTTFAGESYAILIDGHDSEDLRFPVYMKKASFRIFRNNLRSFKVRLRLNEVDGVTGSPGRDLLRQSIVVESSIRSGWVEFDLSKYSIIVAQPFFLTFEKIHDRTEKIAIMNGYRDFIKKNPTKLKIDSVIVDGRKVVRRTLTGKGIDLPGVFVGVGTSRFVKNKFMGYVRSTSLGEWKKVAGIPSATVTLSNQKPGKEIAVDRDPCNEVVSKCFAEKMCDDFLDSTGLYGMQLAVSRHGKVWKRSFGMADLSGKVPVNDSMKFRIASISKSLSSLALLRLVNEKKIDLDAPIQTYIPQFPQKKYPLTTRQLAGHLSGFRDYVSMEDYMNQHHYDNALQALPVFENDTLLFKPGSQFNYSFFSWSIIGAIIESVSQKDYLQYMHENVFTPMGLSNTCGDNVRMKISNRSKFYDAAGEEDDSRDMSYMYANGGLLSTAEDLVKLGNSLIHGLSKTEQELLFTSQKTSDGSNTHYGLGWYEGKDKNGHTMWYHSGDSFSSSSHLYIFPEDDLVIAVLANGQEGVLFDVEKLAAVFY